MPDVRGHGADGVRVHALVQRRRGLPHLQLHGPQPLPGVPRRGQGGARHGGDSCGGVPRKLKPGLTALWFPRLKQRCRSMTNCFQTLLSIPACAPTQWSLTMRRKRGGATATVQVP